MKIINCYYSKGQMQDPQDKNKLITWDNVVFECLTANYQSFETPIFGAKFEKIKLKQSEFANAYKGDIKELANKDVEFFYNSRKQLISVAVAK